MVVGWGALEITLGRNGGWGGYGDYGALKLIGSYPGNKAKKSRFGR